MFIPFRNLPIQGTPNLSNARSLWLPGCQPRVVRCEWGLSWTEHEKQLMLQLSGRRFRRIKTFAMTATRARPPARVMDGKIGRRTLLQQRLSKCKRRTWRCGGEYRNIANLWYFSSHERTFCGCVLIQTGSGFLGKRKLRFVCSARHINPNFSPILKYSCIRGNCCYSLLRRLGLKDPIYLELERRGRVNMIFVIYNSSEEVIRAIHRNLSSS